MLILTALLVQGVDMGELVNVIDRIDGRVGVARGGLAEGGYAKAEDIAELEDRGLEMRVAVGRMDRRVDEFRPPPDKAKQPKAVTSPVLKQMQEKRKTEEGRSVSRLRQQTGEPVFGAMKEQLGSRDVRLRG